MGGLGFAGFLLLTLGLLGGVSLGAVATIILPIIGQWAPAFLNDRSSSPPAVFLLLAVGPILLQSIGGILLGIASMRARVFPRWAGILLLAQGILYILTAPLPPSPSSTLVNIASLIPNIVFFLAFAGFGYALMAPGREAVGALPRAASAAYTR